MPVQPSSNEYIAWFETLGKADVGRVGGKNASLGEMVQRLLPQGVRVPEGFATTAAAYRAYWSGLYEHLSWQATAARAKSS